MIISTLGATSLTGSTTPFQGAGASSIPSATLHNIKVTSIPILAAKEILERHHYLHALPGATILCFGVFVGKRLLGALTFGAGPTLAYSLVEGAQPQDCMTLTRLWLSDELPKNSESRIIGIVLKALRKYTTLKFLITYADPAQNHNGCIYQSTNWIYTGLSSAMPLYDIGDGKPRHSRSISHRIGSHSIKYLTSKGIRVKLVEQTAKHRYIYFLDSDWRTKLKTPILPYPKKELKNEHRRSAHR